MVKPLLYFGHSSKIIKKWVDEVYEIFVRCFDEDVLSTVEMIVHELFGDELSSLKGDLIIPATLIRFKIEYTETDDIRKFADFIMDLDRIIKLLF